MLKVINLISLMSILLSLCGCEGLPDHKWLENNTFYSSKLPSMEIQVSQHLQEGTENSMNTTAESSNNSSTTGLLTNTYVFWDKEGKQQLVIHIENINQASWYMNDFDFSSNPSFLTVSEEKMGGWRFDTGIYVKSMPQQTFLVKIYGRIFGNQTRFALLYLEGVNNSWNKTGLVLNSEQRAFLEEFEKRAGESFTIRPYSGIKPPDQRSNVIVSKQ